MYDLTRESLVSSVVDDTGTGLRDAMHLAKGSKLSPLCFSFALPQRLDHKCCLLTCQERFLALLWTLSLMS